jgi:hypothetical protein
MVIFVTVLYLANFQDQVCAEKKKPEASSFYSRFSSLKSS